MAVRLRPHHILCSIGFEGYGYDAPFTANMSHIVYGQLRAHGGEQVPITITRQADSICAPCPKRRGSGCETLPVIEALDARHAEALGLGDRDQLTWGDCLGRVRDNVTPDDLDTLCQGCSWLELGICKRRLQDLLDT